MAWWLLAQKSNFVCFPMESILNLTILHPANLVLLVALLCYLLSKLKQHPSVPYLLGSLTALSTIVIGNFLFTTRINAVGGARFVLLGIAFTPVLLVPASQTVGRVNSQKLPVGWTAYYGVQAMLLMYFVYAIASGGVIEWVTGILEQPIIIVGRLWSYFFLNTIVANVLALVSLDRTLNTADKSQRDQLKFVFIAFLILTIYFSYLSINLIISSYISQSTLQFGSIIIFFALISLAYGFAKYPLWHVKIHVSRRVVFGSLSITAAVIYLIISGGIVDLLRLLQPQGFNTLAPTAAVALGSIFLLVYLSPNLHTRVRRLITKNFFRNKYDYRDLWMKFSEKSSGSLNIRDLLPAVAEFVAHAMFVPQVAFWLRSPASGTYHLAYCLKAPSYKTTKLLKLADSQQLGDATIFTVPLDRHSTTPPELSICDLELFHELGIRRVVFVKDNNEVLAIMGVGIQRDTQTSAAEDDQFLASVSNQLSHLIMTHKLSEELLLAKEWDSFNRFASFILHDLKNLATMQSMTLDNAKHLLQNPHFIADAFATFSQTTEKMINLIASLSVQRGQFSLKQQPVNILEIILGTFDDLKIEDRNGVQVMTAFPPKEQVPAIAGDPELLRKAFTNLILNALQSLPHGEGAVEVAVSRNNGKITASIRDTGCGIPPERLENLFRPFQTTKEKGLGIGLCHTRSIIEVHGGQIRIESQVNSGTKVEVELPTL